MIRQILIYIAVYVGLFVSCFYLLSILSVRKLKKPKLPEKLPFVSVIIPAYNEERGVVGSIMSSLKLDYPKEKLEVIIVDDGSQDSTFEKVMKAKKELNDKRIKVIRLKKNSGKGKAMNIGIKMSKGEIIVTMDADNTIPERDALKKLVSYFNREEVMCVSPAIAIYKPRGILQRVQQIEYLFGVFLRKAFSSVNSIHITPGAFSVYKKEFFEKHGYFDEDNLTEDMEMALRIQYKGFIIENNPNAVVYTVAPKKFKPLLLQRRRWYAGLFHNLMKYKTLFSRKYGVMGILVLPVAVFSIIFSMILTSWIVIDTIRKLRSEIILWNSVNFNILGSVDLSIYILKTYFFRILTDPITLFLIFMIAVLLGYLFYAKRKVKRHANIKLSIFFFLVFFSFLFAFWWAVAFIYTFFNKKISWR